MTSDRRSSWPRAIFLSAALCAASVHGASQDAGSSLPTEDPPQTTLHPMLAETIAAGPYDARWASLVRHPLPAWFTNDKIGLSAHWGPYAVPGWTARKDSPYGVAYAEWYRVWIDNNPAVRQYHADTYGSVPYDDFFDGTRNLVTGEIDRYDAESFDADAWMRLFQRSGVKYFFITAKHHDGFCLWDTAYTDRNAAKTGPRRDLLRELVDAARRHGIRIGFYYSFYEWHNPYYTGDRDAPYAGLTELGDEDGDGVPGEYVDDFMIPQIKELIDEFHPDYLCFDGEWDHGYPWWRARQVIAYYYNQAARRGQQVVINDRFGQAKEGVSDTRGVYGDFFHVEYVADIDRSKPWAMWRGFGNSYGYNRNEPRENILTVAETIRLMVDVVADNGNVEFNLGPKADGTLAAFEVERLEAMGRWLAVNGQAIYGTTKSPLGRPEGFRFTHRAATNRLYVLIESWPEDGVLEIPQLVNEVTSAVAVADGGSIAFDRPEHGGVRLRLPEEPIDPFVSVVAIDYVGELVAPGADLGE